MNNKYKYLLLFLLCASTFSRKEWESTDVMPIISSNNAIAIEFSQNYFWIASCFGIVRIPYIDGNADKSSWESWYIEREIIDIAQDRNFIYIFTDSIIYKADENVFHEDGFIIAEDIPRFAPNIGGCPPLGESYYMPFGLIWLQDGYIKDLPNDLYEIIDCARDNNGNLYILTNGIGIYKIESRSYYAEEFDFGPCCDNNPVIKKIAQKIVFGSYNNISKLALTILVNDEYSYVKYDGYNEYHNKKTINDIEFLNDKILLATSTGLELYDPVDSSWIRAIGMNSIQISSANALEIFDGNIYVASDDGIYSADSHSRLFIRLSNASEFGFKTIESIAGKLYAAGDRGVWLVEKTGLSKFNTPDGIVTNYVTCLAEGTAGEAIFGSQAGILIISAEGAREIYSRSSDLFGSQPNDIVATRGYLWVATNIGLLVIDRKYKTVNLLGETHYLPEIPISSLLLDGDILWLSTSRGVFKFYWNEPDRVY